MAEVTGMLDIAQLKETVAAGQVDTVVVAFTDLYGRFMGKRLDAGFFLDSAASEGTHACDYLLTADMEMEPVQGYRLANWKRGYGDFHLVPDMGTLRRLSWQEKTALVLCDVKESVSHELVAEAPRSVLRGQTATGPRPWGSRPWPRPSWSTICSRTRTGRRRQSTTTI